MYLYTAQPIIPNQCDSEFFLRSGMFLLLLIETESTNGEVGVGDRVRKSDALSIVDEIAGLIR